MIFQQSAIKHILPRWVRGGFEKISPRVSHSLSYVSICPSLASSYTVWHIGVTKKSNTTKRRKPYVCFKSVQQVLYRLVQVTNALIELEPTDKIIQRPLICFLLIKHNDKVVQYTTEDILFCLCIVYIPRLFPWQPVPYQLCALVTAPHTRKEPGTKTEWPLVRY